MTVSWVSRGNSYGKLPVDVRELNELARESDRFRSDVQDFGLFRCSCPVECPWCLAAWQVESHGKIHERSGRRSSRRVRQEVHGRVREAWHQALHLRFWQSSRLLRQPHTPAFRTSMYVRTDIIDGCAVSKLVQLGPGETPPSWGGEARVWS